MGDRDVRRAIRLLLRDARGAALAEERARTVEEAYDVLAEADPDERVEVGDSELGGTSRGVGLVAVGPGKITLEALEALVEMMRAPDDGAGREDDLATQIGRSPALRFTLELGAVDAGPELFPATREATDEAARDLRDAPVNEPAEGDLAAIEEALGASAPNEALARGLAAPALGLLDAAVRLAAVSQPAEVAALAEIVAHQLTEDVASLPSQDRGDHVQDLLEEVDRLAKNERKLVEALTGGALEQLTLAALGDPDADAAAVDALSDAAVGGAVELVHRVSSLPPSPRRDAALRSIASLSDVSGLVKRRMSTLDPGATSALLDGLRHAEVGADTLDLFKSALDAERPEARARALSWLHHKADARDSVADCLRSEDPVLRLAALYLALRSEPDVARELIAPWYEELDGVDLDVRRLATLAYVDCVGDEALPKLRKAVRSTAFRKKAREARAAAIAGVGALGDGETLPQLRTLAKKAGGKDPVANEAGVVVAAIDADESPYDVRALLERELSRLGVREAIEASELPPAADEPPVIEIPSALGHMATMPNQPRPINLTDPSSTNLRPPRRPRLDSNVGVPTEDLDEDVPKSEPTKPSARALSPGYRAPQRVEGSERPSSLPPPPLNPEEAAALGTAATESPRLPTPEPPVNPLLKKAPRGDAPLRAPAAGGPEGGIPRAPRAPAEAQARPANPLLKRVRKGDAEAETEPEEPAAPPANLEDLLRAYVEEDES